MKSGEKIILDFSVKKCCKGHIYQITIDSDNKSLGLEKKFQTEILRSQIDGEEIHFKNELPLIFSFGERQKLTIVFIKRIIVDKKNNYKVKVATKETQLSSIIASPNSIYERCLNDNKKNEDIFCIKVNKTENDKKKNTNIYEFVGSGIKLNTFLAFDFSDGLNKQSRKTSIDNYSKIISNLIHKIYFYAKQQSIYLYGFGAEFNNHDVDLFNLNEGDDLPISLDKVGRVFGSKQNSIKPKKKVILSKLIRKITKIIFKLYEARNYNVLFLFLREIPDKNDKQEIIDTLIEASYLPLTIIIIGEGNNDFNQLKEFFGDKVNEASSGMIKNRENILFTDFYNNFNENEESFTQCCLEELSKQMIEFYDLIKVSPQQILKNNMRAIEKSFMQYNKVSICIYQSYMKNSNNFMSNIYESKINNNFYKGPDKNKQIKKENQEKNEIVHINLKNEDKEDKKNYENINNNTNNINNINSNKRFIPESSVNINWNLCNPYKAKKKLQEDQKEELPKKSQEDLMKEELKTYKITPGKSILKINQNPYNKKKVEEKEEIGNKIYENPPEKSILKINQNVPPSNSKKEENKIYKLTPGQSIWTINPDNPYNNQQKEEDEKETIEPKKKLFLIPQHSTCVNIISTNPYVKEKDKKENNQKNSSKIDSYNISTEESAQLSNNINTKVSSGFRFNANYSIDN